MKILTSSYSKAIIDKNRYEGFSCFKDLSLNISKICLLPSKSSVRIRFLHLLSVQHRRLQPVSSSSSLSPDSKQVDLEAIKTQLEEKPSKTAHVKFQLQKECSFGEHFYMVGDHPMFGLWDPESAIPLTWSEGHVWTLELDIPVGVSILYKFILKTSTGNLLWQPGPDRMFKSWDTKNTIIVCEDWEDAKYQKVIEEQEEANPDGTDADNISFPGKEPLQALSEEWASSIGASSIEKPLDIVSENVNHQTVDFMANANNEMLAVERTNCANDEALAISSKNVLVAENLGDTGKVETVQNSPSADVEEKMVIDEGSPILVPGMTPLSTMSSDEAVLDEDDKSTASNAPVEINEVKYQKMSELDEKQEPEEEAQEEEITAVSKDHEEELVEEPQVVASEEQPDREPFQSNVWQIEQEKIAVSKDWEEQLDNTHIDKPKLASEELPDKEPLQSNALQSEEEEEETTAVSKVWEEELDNQHIEKSQPVASEEQAELEPSQSNVSHSDVQVVACEEQPDREPFRSNVWQIEQEKIAVSKDCDEQLDNTHIDKPKLAIEELPDKEPVQSALQSEEEEEETTAVYKVWEEELDNQHIEKSQPVASEEQAELEPSQSNVSQSDVQWGRKTLKKLLSNLGFQ